MPTAGATVITAVPPVAIASAIALHFVVASRIGISPAVNTVIGIADMIVYVFVPAFDTAVTRTTLRGATDSPASIALIAFITTPPVGITATVVPPVYHFLGAAAVAASDSSTASTPALVVSSLPRSVMIMLRGVFVFLLLADAWPTALALTMIQLPSCRFYSFVSSSTFLVANRTAAAVHVASNPVFSAAVVRVTIIVPTGRSPPALVPARSSFID